LFTLALPDVKFARREFNSAVKAAIEAWKGVIVGLVMTLGSADGVGGWNDGLRFRDHVRWSGEFFVGGMVEA
jgi:hypothetical protein